jgi:hypothetical protein
MAKAMQDSGVNSETCDAYISSVVNDIDAVEDCFESILGNRGSHDEPHSSFEVGDIVYQTTIDIGAYRDLQRHRVGTQSCTLWSDGYGYSIPDVLEVESLNDLRLAYVEHMNEVESLVSELRTFDRFFAEYYVNLGFNVRWTYRANLKQFVYLIELRSGESGHYSYRKIAQNMYLTLKEKLPILSKYVRVNLNDYSDRRKAEEIIQSKLNKASSL